MGELRPFVVMGQHRPHELCLLAAGPLITLAWLLRPVSNPGLSKLPEYFIIGMYVSLFVGGVIGLAGIAMRRAAVGPGLEQGGLLIQAGGVMLSVLATILLSGFIAWTFETIFAMWATANIARAIQIQAELKRGRDAQLQ